MDDTSPHRRTNNTDDAPVSGKARPSLLVNALSNWVVLGLNIVIGIVLTPIITRYLGTTGFGIWMLINSFVGYYGLINLGVGSAVTRYVGRYSSRQDNESMNRTVGTALSMFSVTGLLVFAISLLIAGPLVGFFNVAPQLQREFQLVVIILGLATALEFPGNLFGATLRAHEYFVSSNLMNVFRALVRAALTIGLLLAGVGLVGVAAATLAASLLSLVGRFILCRYLIPEVRFSYREARWSMLGTLVKFGGFSTVIMVADILRNQVDSIVIGKCVGLSAVGVYAIAIMVIRYTSNVIVTALNVLTPRFARLDGAGQQEELKALFIRSITLSSLMAFGMGMLLVIFGGALITLWVGMDYSEAIPVLWILAFSAMFGLAQNPAVGMLYALNKHKFYAYATLTEGVINLCLSLILVWKWGIIGVALGTAIPMLIFKIVIMPIYVTHVVQLSIFDYLKRLAIPATCSMLAIALAWETNLITRGADISIAMTALWGAAFAVGFFLVATAGLHVVGARLVNVGEFRALRGTP